MLPATIGAKDAANYLGVSIDTIYTMVKEKKIPHIRARRRILFRTKALDDWMTNQEQEAM